LYLSDPLYCSIFWEWRYPVKANSQPEAIFTDEHGNVLVFHRAVEPDSRIAVFGQFSRSANRFFISLILYSLERLREFDHDMQPNDKNVKKVPNTRDQGIGLNGTVNNEIVAVFNKKTRFGHLAW